MDECAECGFRYADLPVARIADVMGSFGARYAERLSGVDESHLRRRPAPQVWSALEYACHVRDVLLVQRDRALCALVEDRPDFPRMHRDERVLLAGYADETPGDVLGQLAMAGQLIARVFRGLTAEQFARLLVYNYPEPAEHDVAWLGRHAVHEGEHHLGDVEQVLGR
ncbi:MAG: DinB family protein [Streptosporangiales bacterium]|nr:DinB family protein [Streptosporangiales bacterium]